MRIDTNDMSNVENNLYDTVEQTKAFETAFLNPLCYEKLNPEIDSKEIG